LHLLKKKQNHLEDHLLAFGLAAAGAGIGLGFVGSAGLAVISENPALQSKVFIFIGMVESIAIYGIVMMFIILGQ